MKTYKLQTKYVHDFSSWDLAHLTFQKCRHILRKPLLVWPRPGLLILLPSFSKQQLDLDLRQEGLWVNISCLGAQDKWWLISWGHHTGQHGACLTQRMEGHNMVFTLDVLVNNWRNHYINKMKTIVIKAK